MGSAAWPSGPTAGPARNSISEPLHTVTFRGEQIDLGGRRLRIVREGPVKGQPLIVCEHGAFGCAADWAVVQERLAAQGLRSLAYDRAGLGHSDPGLAPRDGAAIVGDLGRLLDALEETAPVVLAIQISPVLWLTATPIGWFNPLEY